jgi:hypothetical protein
MKLAYDLLLVVASFVGAVSATDFAQDGIETEYTFEQLGYDDTDAHILPDKKSSNLRKLPVGSIVGSDTVTAQNGTRQLVEETDRFIVKYKSKAGRKKILSHAKRVYHDFRTKALVVELPLSKIYSLFQHPGIVNIEDDSFWDEQGFEEETIDPQSERARELAQVLPWGISKVQADQLSSGYAPVRVCIADTGVLKSHPDLPRFLMK